MAAFEQLIKNVIGSSELKSKYERILIANIHLYKQAFTAASVNPDHNYEMYEQLGDVSVNKFLVWYFYMRFPQLATPKGVKVVARLRTNYSSKNTFASIADSYGFWPFIQASEQQKDADKKSLLEDVFEAFIGVTEMILDNHFSVNGVGYMVIQRILSSIFDKLEISLKFEDLYDAKTRVKELFDTRKDLGIVQFNYDPGLKEATVVQITPNNVSITLARSKGAKKTDAQRTASAKALEALEKQGIRRIVDYSEFYNA